MYFVTLNPKPNSMAKNIVQKVTFKNTKPAKVFELYANAKKHSAIAGSPVKVSTKAGAATMRRERGLIWGTQLLVAAVIGDI